MVRVTSRRGEVAARADLTEEVRPGQVFIPMHYFETNRVTFPNFDPYSHQPGYKYAAVRVEAVQADPGHDGEGRGGAEGGKA